MGGWYPDSARFIVSIAIPGKPASVWAVPVRGGTPERLADVEDMGVLRVQPLSDLGTPVQLVEHFGAQAKIACSSSASSTGRSTRRVPT
jgi:hypothetical protein